MKVPTAWNARQQQLRLAGHCAICGKSTKGDHSACSLEAEKRRKANGEKPSARKRDRHYMNGSLPKWMFS